MLPGCTRLSVRAAAPRTPPILPLPLRPVRGINVLGFPALSIPTGLDEAGMPLSLQIVGKPFAEAAILNAGAALEDAIQFPGLVQTQ